MAWPPQTAWGGSMCQFPKIGGPRYRPQNTLVLLIRPPKKVPLLLGNSHVLDGQPQSGHGSTWHAAMHLKGRANLIITACTLTRSKTLNPRALNPTPSVVPTVSALFWEPLGPESGLLGATDGMGRIRLVLKGFRFRGF